MTADERTQANIDTFIEPATEAGGIPLRPLSAGTLTICRALGLTMVVGGDKESVEALSSADKQRQLTTFLFIQSQPLDVVKKAVKLARVMVAAARRKGVKLADPAEIHKRLRYPHTGRINPRSLKSPYPVDASALRALKRDLLKRVGELAAGWNAGAQKLVVKLPAWVARHGSKRSAATVINTFRVFRIILTNAVKYVTNVESFDRRIQSAINIQGKKMRRRAVYLLTRALSRAGWK